MTYNNHWEDFLESSNHPSNGENSSYFDKYTAVQGVSDPLEKEDYSYKDRFVGRGRKGKQVKDVNNDAETENGSSPKGSSQQRAEIRNKLRDIRSSFHERDLPQLSKQAERQLSSNFKQLSLVEGNLSGLREKGKTIYITSSFPGEGKTTAAVNMAYGLAVYSGKDTLLVDCNFSSPQIHRLFKAPNTIGLRDVFFQDTDITEAILPTFYDHLYLITSGHKSLSESVTIEEGRLQKILKELGYAFEYVIFDGRSVFSSSEPEFFAQFFRGLILVVKCEKTKWEVLQMANEKIQKAGGTVLGVVLNKRKYYMPEAIYRLVSKR